MTAKMITLLMFLDSARAHGYLSQPKSRNYLAREQHRDWCPHCLNGGTVGTVMANSIGGWPYPETAETAVRHGLCGDPAPAESDQSFMIGGEFADGRITSSYESGAIIPVEFAITTHHRGHVEFSLCDLGTLPNSDGPITQECLNEHKLTVVDGQDDPSFVDPAYPGRYYLPPKCAGSSTTSDIFYPDSYTYKAMVQLPTDLSCEHCVLQWYYVTANSCNPPGYRTAPWPATFAHCDGDGPGLGWYSPVLGDCGDGGYPEEFWNCADIEIVSSGPTVEPAPTRSPTFEPTLELTSWEPTPNPTPSSGDCLPEWSTCGTGECCENGLQCFRQHQWYSQCLKACPSGWECDDGSTTPQPTATPQPTSGQSGQPTSAPTTSSISNPPGESNWDVTTTTIMYKGERVLLQGFAVTCLEYLLRGIGTECLAEYNWADAANIITAPNMDQVNALLSLLRSTTSPNVMPTVRLSLTASYYLDVESPNWAANRAKFPDLAAQYRTLLDNLVDVFTSEGVLVMLDLHWNDDVSEQEPMALRASDFGPTGDSVEFWSALAARFGDNDLVWYEPYNEPHATSYSVWLDGGDGFEGMRPMYEAIRAHTVNPIVIAGQSNYAYDAASLVRFHADVQPSNVVYNLHPYMGPLQSSDPSKTVEGFEERVATLQDRTGAPVIITEFGQYCCGANEACYLYSGSHNGQPMGYVEAVLSVCQTYDVSWTAWAWRPNAGSSSSDCNQPDANDGLALYDADNHGGLGADWDTLFPRFYGAVTSA